MLRLNPSVRYSHVQILLYSIFTTLTTGVFLNDYLLKIGFTEYHFGVLYALFYLPGVIAFPISFYVNTIVRKRLFFNLFTALSLVLAAVFTAAPYVPGIGPGALIWVSILSLGGSNIVVGIGRIVLFPWLYHIVGASGWVRFFSIRQGIIFGISMVCTLGFGWVLDNPKLYVSTGFFVLAMLAGAASVLFSRYIPEHPPGSPAPVEPPKRAELSKRLEPSKCAKSKEPKLNMLYVWSIIKQISGSRGYLGLLIYNILLSFGIGLFTPLVFPYLITEIGISSTHISIYQTLMMITSVIALLMLTRLDGRKGNLAVLRGFSSLLWIIPMLLLLIPYLPVFFSYLLFALGVTCSYGLLLTAAGTVMFNLFLEYTPESNKTVYLALIECTRAVSLSVGSYISGFTVQHAGSLTAFGLPMSGYQGVFISSVFFMVAAYVLILRLRQPV
ncbi:MFS transporter [Paenibacillus eucommiae]|uniref:Major facilitator superfamily (MFS) profile domain-containing protein n=1 Tax=Paenibacillus eucommiae TaxID=1355755 RepID=A0ABS4IX87_9BACL|nr:MFS transporter [Paenibacillus eucommiae]MBP1992197.1 hypothetical protein [Paenibacillus eucommiae]